MMDTSNFAQPLGDGNERSIVQVITEDQKFTKNLPSALEKWGLQNAGFDYDVVAVFGSQSTGKSTLLNRVFGTTFDVMSETERRQTTKGIWMCKGENMNVLVMDVEGTDGRERGEDQDFERKSALFSMAAAEVLIVNLWEHQVGLYQGANMGLLKTVMEVNLALFQASRAKDRTRSSDKALLLFVIRDHIGTTPLENLRNTITTDLNRLWEGLSKPDGLEASKISDYFDLDFTALPHKLLQPKDFDDGVDKLRNRFANSSAPDYVFKPNYHKRIPADGVAPYMEGVWEQILENKDLDLPTQQELLAQFRCDEIGAVAYKLFEDVVHPIRRPVETGNVVETLGQSMLEATTVSLTHFDRDASRYHSGVYQRKRSDLVSKMHTALSPLFLTQLKNLQKHIVKEFKSSVLEQLKGEKYDFGAVVSETRARAEKEFNAKAQSLVLEGSSWSIDEAYLDFTEDLENIAETCRIEETKKMIAQIERTMKKTLSEPIELALNKPTKEMWDKVIALYKEALSTAEATYLRKAKSFNCTEEENTKSLDEVRRQGWRSLRGKIDEQTADSAMLVRLKLFFEERFRYDSEGVPRVWKPEDDIDAAFRKAKEDTLELIPLYGKIEPSEEENKFEPPAPSEDDDEPLTIAVLSGSKQDDLGTRFRREADAYYIEAKRSLVLTSSQIPYWIYGVLVVLGWNEFLAVIRSPLYFTFVLILIATAYIMLKLNLMGPAASVARGIYREVVREAQERLQAHFSQQQQTQQQGQNIQMQQMQPGSNE